MPKVIKKYKKCPYVYIKSHCCLLINYMNDCKYISKNKNYHNCKKYKENLKIYWVF